LRDYTLQQRLKAICKALGVEFSSLAGKLDIVNRRGRSDNSADIILESLIRHCNSEAEAGRPYSMIIIDPLYCLLVGLETEIETENSNRVMGELSEAFKQITRETDTALVVAHHHRKGNLRSVSSLDRGSGAGTTTRALDLSVDIVEYGDAADDTFKVSLGVREFKKPNSFIVRREENGLLVRSNEKVVEEKTGRPRKVSDDSYVAILLPDGLTDKEWKERAINILGVSERTFQSRKKELLKTALVGADGDLFMPTQIWYSRRDAASAEATRDRINAVRKAYTI
jgi:RecA-family ATPase